MEDTNLLSCYSCNYFTNKKFNLNRHVLNKHKNDEMEINDEIKINDEMDIDDKNEIDDKKDDKNINYIYLLQEREFIKSNENIYKIGKSKQENLKRIINYPNGTKLLLQMSCNNCDYIESCLIKIFKKEFINKKDIGYEYFEGDVLDMIEVIYNYIINDIKKNKIINTNNKKCYKCDKIVSSKNYLEKHLKTCKGVSNPLECHLCHKILANRGSKSRHLKLCAEKIGS